MSSNSDTLDRMLPYIRRIRNKHKKAYALAYAWHLAYPLDHRHSTEPKPSPNLSGMAAQAVRMNLHELKRS